MSSNHWTIEDMPDQAGRIAVVTGANSGVGYEAARGLACKGTHLVLACRSLERGEAAASRIRSEWPTASLAVMELDLADLSSVRRFADTFQSHHAHLHILCNNAGIMAIPYRKTADGFEMQFGTNHLGHFALTGLLLDRIVEAPDARVVTVSSNLHRKGQIRFHDLNWETGYQRSEAYSQSKLANLLFAYELQRRLQAAGHDAISVGCHPGYAATNLQMAGPEMDGSDLRKAIMQVANRLFAQSQEMGALPILYAATAPEVNGCDYIGPDGFMGLRGYPQKERSTDDSYDPALAAQLWSVSQELTGVRYLDGDASASNANSASARRRTG